MRRVLIDLASLRFASATAAGADLGFIDAGARVVNGIAPDFITDTVGAVNAVNTAASGAVWDHNLLG
jgi:hypothetical protein